MQGQYGLSLEVVERWTALGGVERVSEHLDAHRAAGVGEFVLMPLGRDPLRQIERLVEVRSLLTPSSSEITTADRGARG